MIERISFIIIKGFAAIVSGIGILVVLSGFFIFGYQIYFWLKEGYWIERDLLLLVDLLQSIFSDNLYFLWKWLRAPQDWQGLHRLFLGILEFIPLSLFLIAFGGMIWSIGKGLSEEA